MGYISLIVYQKWQHVNIDSQRRKEKKSTAGTSGNHLL